MKKLYMMVFLAFILSIVLFVGAFIYLDKTKRKTFNYILSSENGDKGYVKVERFGTEDRLIYRSESNFPFRTNLSESKTRLVLDKNYNLEYYLKKNSGNGASETVYIENREGGVSFVGIQGSEFASSDNLPIKKGTFLFGEDSILTYLPIIENYNFNRGRIQGFNTITVFSPLLPPMKRFVTLTSVRDDYLIIESRRIKAECLLLKIRNYPQGILWVAKSDQSLVKLEIPQKRFSITRTFDPKAVEAKEYAPTEGGYLEKDVKFKSKNTDLAGVLTVPEKEGRFPAVILTGASPQDRNYRGLFRSIAADLSKKGFCVLRFDGRGIGKSGGDYSATSFSDKLQDLKAALGFVAALKEVDPQKIVILAHSKAALAASKLASEESGIGALILMAPRVSWLNTDMSDFKDLKNMAAKSRWSDNYLKLAMKSRLEIINKLKDAKRSWISVSGKRCFVKKMQEESGEDIMAIIKKIKIPVLTLQTRQDELGPADYASIFDAVLEEGGNKNHVLKYFGYLDYMFGERVNDGIYKIHYEVDNDAMNTIRAWLNENLSSAPAPEELQAIK